MPTFKDAKTGAAITVKITPRARKNEVLGVMEDGTIRLRVAAVPEEGAANRELARYLSEILDIPVSQVDIVSGLTSEKKLISLVGITPADVEARVKRLAEAHAARAKSVGKRAEKRKASGRRKRGEK